MDATFTKWRDLGLNEATPAGLDYILGSTLSTLGIALFNLRLSIDFIILKQNYIDFFQMSPHFVSNVRLM